jgi:beta-glucosidase
LSNHANLYEKQLNQTRITSVSFFLHIFLGPGTYSSQPDLESRAVASLIVNQLRFKDLNKNNTLDRYEDWRLPVDQRIDDLVKQMTLSEKVGMMLINTLNADPGGKVPLRAVEFVQDEKMTRFIFRHVVTQNPPALNIRLH